MLGTIANFISCYGSIPYVTLDLVYHTVSSGFHYALTILPRPSCIKPGQTLIDRLFVSSDWSLNTMKSEKRFQSWTIYRGRKSCIYVFGKAGRSALEPVFKNNKCILKKQKRWAINQVWLKLFTWYSYFARISQATLTNSLKIVKQTYEFKFQISIRLLSQTYRAFSAEKLMRKEKRYKMFLTTSWMQSHLMSVLTYACSAYFSYLSCSLRACDY